MRRATISTDSESGLGVVSPLYKVGPMDTVSLKAQNKIWINPGDIFTELLNGLSVRIRVRLENLVCTLICSPADDPDWVSYRAGRTCLAD